MDKRLFTTISVVPGSEYIVPSNIPSQLVSPRWVQYESKQSFVNIFGTSATIPAGIAAGGFVWNWANTRQGKIITDHLGFATNPPTTNTVFIALYCEPNAGVTQNDPITITKGGYSTFYQSPVELSETGGWIYFTISTNHYRPSLTVASATVSSNNTSKVLTIRYGYAIDLKNVNGGGEDFSGETINSLVNIFGGQEIKPGENYVAPEVTTSSVSLLRNGVELSSSNNSRDFSLSAGDSLSVTGGECVFRATVSDTTPSYSLYHMAMVGDSQMAQDMYTNVNYISGKITPIVGVPKPLRAIGNLTGLNVEERSKGSTGFYSQWDAQQAYAFRAGLIKSNTDVVFFDLTANDFHKLGNMDACLDKNGGRVSFSTFANSWTNWGSATFEEYPLDETVTGTEWGSAKPTFAAYYNETFQKVWNKAPFAKIVIFFYGAGSNVATGYNATADGKNRGLAIRLVQKWKKAGKDIDYWSCGHNTYAGKGYATDYVDNIAQYRTGEYANPAGRNPYAHADYGLNYYGFGAGIGGSNADTAVTVDNYTTCAPFVVSYGCWPGPWHANKDWFEQYFNPLFATFIAHMCGFADSTLPAALRLTEAEYQQKNEAWIDYGTDPSEWYQPKTDGLWRADDTPQPEPSTYEISVTSTGCTVSGASTITEGSTVTLTATANSGYSLPEVVTVTGASFTWDKATGALTLSSPTGAVNVTVTAEKLPSVYSITVTASDCTVSGASTITEGSTAELIATADSGYSLPDEVTVIGAAHTWDKTSGVIVLSSPTGSVDVSVRATITPAVTPTTRKHWKTYSAESSGVTVTSEAGTVAQTLTVSGRTLAFVGESVTVSVNGESVGTNPQTLTVKAGDTVSASGGACVFRVRTRHEFAKDGSDVFFGLNWVCVGDSLLSVQQNGADGFNNYSQAVKAWEMLSGQYAAGRAEYDSTNVTNNMKRPALMSGINCYGGKNLAGTLFAQGGTGMYRKSPYYLRLEDCPHDADIITIYGSINDWNYRVSGASGDEAYGSTRGKFFTDSSMAKFTDRLTYAQNVMEKDGYDATDISTYARYVSKAIETAHRQAPLAKVVVLSPIFYNVQNSDTNSRLYSDPPNARYIVVQDYHRKYGADWLSWATWGLQSSAAYDSSLNRWTITTASNSWLDDNSILVDGETISAHKMMSDTAFAEKYVYDYSASAASYGHMNTLYNEIYIAPKFANLICDTLGLSGYYLPQGLKCNNLTYTKPEEPDPEPDSLFDWFGNQLSLQQLWIRNDGATTHPTILYDVASNVIAT